MTEGVAITTPLTRLLGMRQPIVLAGMAHTSLPALVAAVTNAGGLGCLGGLGYTVGQLRAHIRQVRALLQLPIHTVKLDQSLIGGVGRDPRVSKLVRAMLGAAKSLDARIVAEGVEDEAQAIFLRAAGADRMQGYLFARPMPGDDCEALMRAQAAGAEAPTDRIMAAAATLRTAAF